MKGLLLTLVATLTLTDGQTVQQISNQRSCSTVGVAGLSKQLTEQVNCLRAGSFKSLAGQPGIRLGDAAVVVPFAQGAVVDQLVKIAKATGKTISVNSALRTLAQQVLLYDWQDAGGTGGCGITVAGVPGASNHNGGLAVDIADSYSWIDSFAENNLRWLGSGDPPHFDYMGSDGVDIRSWSVKAFQTLWNLNNPNDLVTVDGSWGPATESRIRKSPANGFPKGATCGSSLPGYDPLACTTSKGETGKCQDVATCTNGGTPYAGFCEGASNIQCCVKSSSGSAPTPTTTPAPPPTTPQVPQNDCEKTYGVAAQCGNPSTCSNSPSGTVSSLCPGDSTNVCCLNFSLKNVLYQDASNAFQNAAMDKFQKNFLSTSSFLPKFQTYSCLYRNKIETADKWTASLGYCGEAISFRLASFYYSNQVYQDAAINYLQGEVMKMSSKDAYYTFIKEFRNVIATATGGSSAGTGTGGGSSTPVSPPLPPATNTGCTKKMPSELTMNKAGLDLITHFEGYFSKCYLDSENIWTIGYGHACHVAQNDGSGCLSGAKCDQSKVMSRNEAMQFLAKDLKIATDAVKQYVKVPITSNQFAALASFAFNVGNGALKDSTLLKMLNAGQLSPKQSQYQFSRWHSSCTEGLKRRRFTEAELFNSCADTINCNYNACPISMNYLKCSGSCQFCEVCTAKNACSGSSASTKSVDTSYFNLPSDSSSSELPSCDNTSFSDQPCKVSTLDGATAIVDTTSPHQYASGFQSCDDICLKASSQCTDFNKAYAPVAEEGEALSAVGSSDSYSECLSSCTFLPATSESDDPKSYSVKLLGDNLNKALAGVTGTTNCNLATKANPLIALGNNLPNGDGPSSGSGPEFPQWAIGAIAGGALLVVVAVVVVVVKTRGVSEPAQRV